MKTVAVTSNRQSGIRGFTLIEVLVVVAIIALLMSILLPSLARARAHASMVACNANMHDLGRALHLYAYDHNPYFPPTSYLGTEYVGTIPACDDNVFVLWYRKYIKDVKSFTCPATKYKLRIPERVVKVAANPAFNYKPGSFTVQIYTAGKLGSDFAKLAQMVSSGGFGTSYEYNVWFSRQGINTLVNWDHSHAPYTSANSQLKTLTTKFPVPSVSVLMHDADEGGSVIGAPRPAVNNDPEPWDNHGAFGMNIVFADGHAEQIKRHKIQNLWDRQSCPN